ncbi:MAG: hypothetical protein ABIN58_06050, partial [candidate division WOR-3 bacterium]
MSMRKQRRKILALFLLILIMASLSFRPPGKAATTEMKAAIPPGVIAFVREETGSSDSTKMITNLMLMDAQNPNNVIKLTAFNTPAIQVNAPAWSKDFSQIAFSSNFNALFSLEDE